MVKGCERISIFGLGYVGVVSLACFAKLGHKVVGVDVVPYKVETLNKGKAPLEEKNLNNLIREGFERDKIRATQNSRNAILNSDISFICVGTPSKRNGDLNLEYLKKVCEEIGTAIRTKHFHIVVVRSTMFPGSLDILKQIIEKASGKKQGRDFELAVNPEFLREGSAIKDFFDPPYIVVGSESKRIGNRIIECYRGVNARKFVVQPKTAQMIKYASNSFHALKITFANEIGEVCKELGVNGKKLMGLFCEDRQLNLSPYYFSPGFAYGGSCLPKDLAALKNNAKKLRIKTPVIDSISKSNLEQIKRAIKLIESKKTKKIGFLGITFKPDTDDIRGNPVLFVLNRLIQKKYDVKIFDRLVNKSNIKIISKSYREEIYDLIINEDLKEKVHDISSLFTNLETVLEQDIILLSHRDSSLKKELMRLGEDKIIIDLQNLFKDSDFVAKYIPI